MGAATSCNRYIDALYNGLYEFHVSKSTKNKGTKMQKEKQKKQPSGCTKALRLLGVIVIGIILTFAGLAWLGSSGLLDTPIPQAKPQEQSTTPANTSAPTISPSNTAMPPTTNPSDTVKNIVDSLPLIDIVSAELNESSNTVMVTFKIPGNTVSLAEADMGEILCALRDGGFTTNTYLFIGQGAFADALANPVTLDAIKMRIQPDVINQINCEYDGFGVNWSVAAETYFVDNRLKP